MPERPRLIREYGCVLCQKWHQQGEPLYESHLFHQSKHGWRERPERPGERAGQLFCEAMQDREET